MPASKKGTPSPDAGDLNSAPKRIRQLEEELTIGKAASAWFDKTDGAPKKENLVVAGLVAKDCPPAGPASA